MSVRATSIAVMAASLALCGCVGEPRHVGSFGSAVDQADGRQPIAVTVVTTDPDSARCEAAAVQFTAPNGARLTVALPSDTPCSQAAQSFRLEDANFDGREDVLVASDFPATNGPVYDYWLQASDGSLNPAPAFDALGLPDPTFDAVTKTISADEFVDAGVKISVTFAIRSGLPVRVGCIPSGNRADPAYATACA